MGILNVTPDSFSDGGCFSSVERAVQHAEQMVKEGADCIDLGGESTRPGATPVSAKEELARVLPVLLRLLERVEVPVAVDTYKPEVAKAVLEAGAHIINDIHGLKVFPEMADVVAPYRAPIILMHNQRLLEGRHENDVIESIQSSLSQSIEVALRAGVPREAIVLDPGIGFGLSAEDSARVIQRLPSFQHLGFPLLVGASRKSFIGEILGLGVKERLEGTLATSVLCVTRGVSILRVHDVQANVRAIRVAEAIDSF